MNARYTGSSASRPSGSEWSGRRRATALATIFCPTLLAGHGEPLGAAIEAPSRIEAHERRVHEVLFSPDGARIASASESEVKLCEVGSGRELMRLPVRRGHLAFRPDGARLATSDSSGMVKIWDAASGQDLFGFRGHEANITSLTFSPDGERLAAALLYGEDRVAKVWDASDGRELLALEGHADHVRHVEFSPDGSRLLTQDAGRTVKVWDASTGRQRLSLDGLGRAAFDADGRQIISATQDGLVTFRDATTGRPIRSVHLEGLYRGVFLDVLGPESQQEPLELATFSRDRKLLAGRVTAGYHSAAVWELEDGMTRVGLSVDEGVTCVAFSPNGRHAAAGGSKGGAGGGEGSLWSWDLDGARLALVLDGAERAVAFDPEGNRIAVKVSDRRGRGQVAIRDATTGRVERVIQADPGFVNAVAFSPDGNQLATLGSEGVALWDAAEGRRLRTWPGKFNETLAFRPDGQQLVASSLGLITAWDPATGQEQFNVVAFPLLRRFNRVAYSPDGTWLAVGTQEGIELLDTARGEWQRTIPVPRSDLLGVENFAFSPDGERIAANSNGEEIVVLDVDSGRVELTFPVSQGGALAYSPDGRWIASASSGAVRIFDSATGQQWLALLPHAFLWDLAFSPDGRRLAAAEESGKVKIWELDLEE
ncbi:WD40 repeat domain-containing protein [Tautonia plasticadhaerens]|uniref:Translocation protein TolB n=1 Tax=Tautonia plasticadhaerens TaxID=2527974 RepID=A0A518HF26_9BACT|nr:WD40 repeat domain-containing protein [Tautonia plasticadhaerens]QDV39457.1 translocation protein TolB [Tautonia plasticadhaerens]